MSSLTGKEPEATESGDAVLSKPSEKILQKATVREGSLSLE